MADDDAPAVLTELADDRDTPLDEIVPNDAVLNRLAPTDEKKRTLLVAASFNSAI